MLSDAMEYPFEGEEMLKTLLVGGAVSLASSLFALPTLFLWGYAVSVCRSVLEGREAPPAFDDWERLAVDGLHVLAIGLLYWLPGLVVAGLSLGFVLVLGVALGSDAFGAVFFLYSVVAGVLGTAYLLAVSYVFPAAVVTYALTDELSAAWDTGALRPILTDGTYAVAWLLAGVFMLAGSTLGGALGWILVGFLAVFYGLLAATYIVTRGAMEALDRPPAPLEHARSEPAAAADESTDEASTGQQPSDEEAAEEPDGEQPADEDSAEQPADEEPDGAAAGADGPSGALEDVTGVGPTTAESLREAGYETVADLQAASRSDLADVEGIGPATADRIKNDVGDG